MIEPGSPAPDFALPDHDGEGVSLGTSLYGVSVDSSYAQRAFRERLGLTFPLLADYHPKESSPAGSGSTTSGDESPGARS